MKLLIYLFTALLIAASHGQTNLRSVMVGTNNQVERPTNFWSANANAINNVISDEIGVNATELFAKTRLATTLAGAQTTVTNMLVANEPNWFSMYSPATNASASGEALLMRYVFGDEAAGGGFQFQSKRYRFVIDTFVNTVTTNNVARFTIGNPLLNGGPLLETGMGVEIRNNGGNAELQAIVRNGTNAQTASGWINTGGTGRRLIVLESSTNGQVSLYSASGITGNLPTLLTNVSGGPAAAGNVFNANVNAGLFVNQTNGQTRGFSVYGVAVQIID